MASPKIVKEVQRLTGRVVALKRFISKATAKCLPFFKSLKQAFAWMSDCEWAIELSQFDIEYKPGIAIEAQVLADFIAEFTSSEYEKMQDTSTLWMVHTNRSSVQKMGEVRVVITSSEGDILKYGIQLQFPATNNEVEYEVILMELREARSLGAKNVLLKSDLKLVIGQINGEYEAKESKMQNYLKLTNQMIGKLEQASFIQVPRSQNSEADEVARYASLKD
ncbi:uncharacterized protein LOC142625199 [Castanea sativa]|uniref:uncharacterized protein LOC142625199 n=1 Tax=Castanea sativa TaxID=21020 RepID=UPI003F64C068